MHVRGNLKGILFTFLVSVLVALLSGLPAAPAGAADGPTAIKVFYSEGTSGEGPAISQRVQQAHPEVVIDYCPPDGITTYLPTTAEDLRLKYNTIMLSDVAYNKLSPQQVQAVRDYVQHGGGFVMIGGTTSLGPGGYGGTPIEEVLPVTCAPNYLDKTVSVRVVYTGHPLLEGLPIDTTPVLYGYDIVFPKDGSDLVLETSDGAALFVCWRYGEGRSVVFSSDISWLWGAGLKNWLYYETFVANILKWAAGLSGFPSIAKLDPDQRTDSLYADPVDTGTGAHLL